MFSKLFIPSYFEEYVPHVKHIFYPCLIIAVGYKSIVSYNWDVFGFIFIIIGVLLALVIMFSIAWRGPIEYWRQIEKTIQVMIKIKDPAVWTAMGFKDVPDVIQITERKTNELGEFIGFSFKDVPVSPAVMNAVANKVLMSKKADFTQELYGHLVPNWRKFQKELKEKGYIVPKNKKNVRGGYILNKKGLSVMYECADKTVIELIEKGE